MPDKQEKQNENDLEPTYGNCHDTILPESERVTERKNRLPRNYGQPQKSADELEDEEFWRRAGWPGGKL